MDDKIEIKHRADASNAAYNTLIIECGNCFTKVDSIGDDCLGFDEQPPHPAGYKDKHLAIVYRCPKCFEKLWHHAVIGTYHAHQRHLRMRAKQNENK